MFLVAGGINGVDVVESDVGGGIPLLGAASLFEFPKVLIVYLRFFYDACFVDGDATQVGEDVDGDVVGAQIHRGNLLLGCFAMGALVGEAGGIFYEFLFDIVGDGRVVQQFVPVFRDSVEAVENRPTRVALGLEEGDGEAEGVVDHLVADVSDAHPLHLHIDEVAVDVAALVVAQRVRQELPRCRAAHEEQGQDYDYERAVSHSLAMRVVCSMVLMVAVRAWALLT